MTDKTANAMWGGRFAAGPDAIMEAINASIGFDQRLAAQDIAGSRAHAAMLAAQGILTTKDADAIREGLLTVLSEIETGAFAFSTALEDIHMNVEARLKEIIGEPAGRLHTARSRNDQIATDFRLWVRDQADAAQEVLTALMQALLAQAEAGADWVMPGFTHLQTAQPVTWGHHMMAYVEMLGRDRSRVADARTRMNESPLGAAALAGTSFPIDRDATAQALGFDRPMANSLDAVADRDFALEFLSAAAISAMHLSRLAEELVIWSSAQFRFVTMSDRFSTGSSIMPHKKNPVLTENLTGLARMVRAAALPAMENVALWHERDISHSSVERMIGPDATITLDFALHRLAGVVEKMLIFPENMLDNMNKFPGLVMSQRVLLALTQAGVSREDAYVMVQRNALKVWEERVDFKEQLLGDADVVAALGEDAIEEKFDMGYHTKHVDTIFKRVFGTT